uniref:Uncharacterized protein n=1 Tax=Romanomermis culicivorax TaxID=13658 RepID=A0A915KQC3_ROMCU
MHVPFVYTNTLRKPIREIIENDHVLKKPGMVYLDDKPVFPLWHMSNAVQTVTLMSTTVVYLKNIRPSYKCQRDGQITEYKNTVSSSYLVEDCEDLCQDSINGVLLITQETFNHMQGCSRRENRSMPKYQKLDYTLPANDYNINANRGDCLKWYFDVLTMGTTLNNNGWQNTKLRITFPELREWLVVEHAEDTSWLDDQSPEPAGTAVGLLHTDIWQDLELLSFICPIWVDL